MKKQGAVINGSERNVRHLLTVSRNNRERFGNASGLTFVLVGSFAVEEVKPLLAQYLGGLPGTLRPSKFRDVGVRYPTGQIDRTLRAGTRAPIRAIPGFVRACDRSPEFAQGIETDVRPRHRQYLEDHHVSPVALQAPHNAGSDSRHARARFGWPETRWTTP